MPKATIFATFTPRMKPQVSELPNLGCWVQKKKRSLPSIFGESYVRKWLVIDPVSRMIEYSDKMHGTPKLLGAFENVIGVKFDHKNKSNRALSITMRKKMPRQAQDAHETTLFVFEEDLSLSLAIHIFYSHPLRLLSEAEKTFLPKHIFDMLPKSAEQQKVTVQRVIKPVDTSEQHLQAVEKHEAGYFGFTKKQPTPANDPLKTDSKTEGSSQAWIDSPSLQGIRRQETVPEPRGSGNSHPAVALENQKTQPKARPTEPQVHQESNQNPVVGVFQPKIPRTAPLRLNLRLNTTRDAFKSKIEEPTVVPSVAISSNRVLQIKPLVKQGPARLLGLISQQAAQEISMRPAKNAAEIDPDDSNGELLEPNVQFASALGRGLQIPVAPARPPFKPIKFTLGKSRIREQPTMLLKSQLLDK